ncbi:energy transducer TonB [Rufibacter sp. DG15C]|uniref:energy transducer TonB n=1 Tax=Rufibacter sp. DG15C TaxID=1379909 RepID=UPI0018D3ED7E|nr:energy transducer TonB [Rufibacter sp. DG15C]
MLSFGCIITSFAQTDSLEYLNEHRIRVYSKEGATYYKVKHWEGVAKGKGSESIYYMSGEKESFIPYAIMDSVKEGMSASWYKTGQMSEKKFYHKDNVHGITEKWFEDGRRKALAIYWQDTLHGTVKTFYPSGALKRLDMYEKGKLKEGHCYAADSTEIAYYPYQVEAKFKGGSEGLYKYIVSKVQVPELALMTGIGGNVLAEFIIDSYGDVQSVHVRKASYKEFADEVARVLKKMPKWEPASLDGEKVSTKYTVPVKFSIKE